MSMKETTEKSLFHYICQFVTSQRLPINFFQMVEEFLSFLKAFFFLEAFTVKS